MNARYSQSLQPSQDQDKTLDNIFLINNEEHFEIVDEIEELTFSEVTKKTPQKLYWTAYSASVFGDDQSVHQNVLTNDDIEEVSIEIREIVDDQTDSSGSMVSDQSQTIVPKKPIEKNGKIACIFSLHLPIK